MKRLGIWLVSAAALILVPNSTGAVLPAGTILEARLSGATGSRVSQPGDHIEATIIAPVFEPGWLAVPPGVTLSGVIESVDRLGLGLKHRTATMKYRFNSIQFDDGRAFPIETRVLEVETARERVSADGTIGGIYPTANLSSGVSFAISGLLIQPEIAGPVIGIKFLIARSPDPEIYFPAGTEIILELTSRAVIAESNAILNTLKPLPAAQEAGIRYVLDNLPRQQTDRAHDYPSDLVNILLLGTRDQIDRAFAAAGWSGEQPHSVLALYRIFHCLVQRMGYSMAPMTTLTLNGKAPDSAYQKSLDTFSKRHHIRIWGQGASDAWLGAATEDVAYMFRGMHLTHAIDREIDNERAKVVNDLWFTGCVDSGSLITREWLRPVSENGASIATDGKIAALRLNDCLHPRSMPPASHQSPKPRPRRRIVQAMVAVGNDIARSNPVMLGYNAGKSFLEQPDEVRSAVDTVPDVNRRTPEWREAAARRVWKRPSPLNMGSVSGNPQDRSPLLHAFTRRGI